MNGHVLAPPHVVTGEVIGPVAALVGSGGVFLGVRADGREVFARLFAERAREAVVVGRPLALLTALRATNCGASVQVDLMDRAPWQRLIEAEGGLLAERLRVGEHPYSGATTASFLQPVLSIRDSELRRSSDRSGGAWGAWSCALTMVEDVTPVVLAAARSASLVLTGRLGRDLAAAACPLLRLPAAAAEILTTLAPGTMAAIVDGELTVVNLTASPWEDRLLQAVEGPDWRADWAGRDQPPRPRIQT